ncbi:MAG TPA: serine/threonine-protein kinase, partial [Allocoleopsis sp.]
MSTSVNLHCINPDCPHPQGQLWDNKYCINCGTTLRLNNRYLPLKLLGEGGFAKVYTVLDLTNNTEKVLKVLIDTQPKALELFAQEAGVLSSLNHPGIPKAESYFTVNSSQKVFPCLVMEKINGYTLEDVLIQSPQGVNENLVLNWLHQSLEILDILHRQKIIHRDIKPANLMIRQETGQIVTIDFGGAKQISSPQNTSTRLYSPGYSPPEQVLGKEITPSADFYALGKTMIQMLTGKTPTDLENMTFRWRDLININFNLADVLDQMIADDADKRPQTVADIQWKLRQNSFTQMNTKVVNPSRNFGNFLEKIGDNINQFVNFIFGLIWLTITQIGQGILKLIWGIFGAITKIIIACLDTFWSMLIVSISTSIGTVIAYLLTYVSPLGQSFTTIIEKQLSIHNIPLKTGAEMLLFMFIGLMTSWGIISAKGFEQKSQPLISLISGIIGYGITGLFWQTFLSFNNIYMFIGLISLSVAFVTLGLGFDTYRIVHALIVAIG